MTILVVAPDTDETALRFAEFAIGRGVPAVVARGFGRVQVTVRAARDRTCRTRIAVDGVEVRAILTRGLGDWAPEPDAERAFARAERYAAFWSAIALWSGPVVNRPSARGFFPRLDPLRLAESGAVLPPRTVILNDGTAPGNEVHRLPDWTPMGPHRSAKQVRRRADRRPESGPRPPSARRRVRGVRGERHRGAPRPGHGPPGGPRAGLARARRDGLRRLHRGGGTRRASTGRRVVPAWPRPVPALRGTGLPGSADQVLR